MKKIFFYVVRLLLVLLAMGLVVGCGSAADNGATDPIQGNAGADSPEAQYLIGKWSVNQGRFGNKVFDFQEDGRLQIEDGDTGQMIEMDYLFVAENTLVLSGYEDFDGTATVNFYENKLDFTITFAGNIFGELYSFTRVDD